MAVLAMEGRGVLMTVLALHLYALCSEAIWNVFHFPKSSARVFLKQDLEFYPTPMHFGLMQEESFQIQTQSCTIKQRGMYFDHWS